MTFDTKQVAAGCNQKESIMFLFQLGLDANMTNFTGMLPWEWSTKLGSCRALIELGQADPMITLATQDNHTLAHLGPEIFLWILNEETFSIETQSVNYIIHQLAEEIGTLSFLNGETPHPPVFWLCKESPPGS